MYPQNDTNIRSADGATVDSDNIRSCLVEIDVIRDDESLAADESLFEQGLIDSLGITILITHLEKKFGISVPQQDLLPDNFDSINAIVDYVNSKLPASNPE